MISARLRSEKKIRLACWGWVLLIKSYCKSYFWAFSPIFGQSSTRWWERNQKRKSDFFPRRIRVTRTAAMLNAAKTKALPETMAPKCDSTHAKPYSSFAKQWSIDNKNVRSYNPRHGKINKQTTKMLKFVKECIVLLCLYGSSLKNCVFLTHKQNHYVPSIVRQWHTIIAIMC